MLHLFVSFERRGLSAQSAPIAPANIAQYSAIRTLDSCPSGLGPAAPGASKQTGAPPLLRTLWVNGFEMV